ncbi:hypothetical protein CLAIMM_10784 isoform 2 [Cladophialophora immunda]|nr:hypothetical protein CLAIMM_10784 isoform 1 [Cladophialophora immunda]OQV06170.1 hypothetical protein CLAIMM_10784 isoform 2 [Cladophialophora immunda]
MPPRHPTNLTLSMWKDGSVEKEEIKSPGRSACWCPNWDTIDPSPDCREQKYSIWNFLIPHASSSAHGSTSRALGGPWTHDSVYELVIHPLRYISKSSLSSK